MEIDDALNRARPSVGDPSDQIVAQHRAQLQEAMTTTTPTALKVVAIAPATPDPGRSEPADSNSNRSGPSKAAVRRLPSMSSSQIGRVLVGIAASVAILIGIAAGINFVMGDGSQSGQDVAIGSERSTVGDPSTTESSEASSTTVGDQGAVGGDGAPLSAVVGYSFDYTDIFLAVETPGTEGQGCDGLEPLYTIRRVSPNGADTEVATDVTGSLTVIDGPGGVSALYRTCDGGQSTMLVSETGTDHVELMVPDPWSFAAEPFWSADGSILQVALMSNTGSGLAGYDAGSGDLSELTPRDHLVLGVFDDGTEIVREANSVSVADTMLVGFEEPWPVPRVRMNADRSLALVSGAGMSGYVVADAAGNVVDESGISGEVVASWSPNGNIAAVPRDGGPTAIIAAGSIIDEHDVTAQATHIDGVVYFDAGQQLAVSGTNEAGQQTLWTFALGGDTAEATVPETTVNADDTESSTAEGNEPTSAATAVPSTPSPGVEGTLPTATPESDVTTAPPSPTSAPEATPTAPAAIPAFEEEPAATPVPTPAAEPDAGSGETETSPEIAEGPPPSDEVTVEDGAEDEAATPGGARVVAAPYGPLAGVELGTDADSAIASFRSVLGEPDEDSLWTMGCAFGGLENTERQLRWGPVYATLSLGIDGSDEHFSAWGFSDFYADGAVSRSDIKLPEGVSWDQTIDEVIAATGASELQDFGNQVAMIDGLQFYGSSRAPETPFQGFVIPGLAVCD